MHNKIVFSDFLSIVWCSLWNWAQGQSRLGRKALICFYTPFQLQSFRTTSVTSVLVMDGLTQKSPRLRHPWRLKSISYTTWWHHWLRSTAPNHWCALLVKFGLLSLSCQMVCPNLLKVSWESLSKASLNSSITWTCASERARAAGLFANWDESAASEVLSANKAH